MSFWDVGQNISLILTGGLQIRGHLRKGRENANASLLSFCYSAYYLHLSIPLTLTLTKLLRKGREVNLDATLRHKDKLFHLFLSRANNTHTHTHMQHIPKMHQHVDSSFAVPRAAGSEVIMRAGSIRSLTPAVYLDNGNINRPDWVSVAAITMSTRPQKLTAVCQTDGETRLDADIFRSFSEKNNRKTSIRTNATVPHCFGDIIRNI